MMSELLFALQQVVPPITTGLPTSIGAYVGMFTGTAAFLFILYDRIFGAGRVFAKMDSKIETLCDKMDDFEGTQAAMDGNLRTLSANITTLTHDFKGVDGTNGTKGAVRDLRSDMATVKKRLHSIDVFTALIKAEREAFAGTERRVNVRREIDAKLLDLAVPDEDI